MSIISVVMRMDDYSPLTPFDVTISKFDQSLHQRNELAVPPAGGVPCETVGIRS